MPYYQINTYTTTGTQSSVGLDNSIAPFGASLTITPLGGTASVTLQYTLNPLLNPTDTDSIANWVSTTVLGTSLSTTTFVGFVTPISRARLNISSLTGTSVVFEVAQGLSTN